MAKKNSDYFKVLRLLGHMRNVPRRSIDRQSHGRKVFISQMKSLGDPRSVKKQKGRRGKVFSQATWFRGVAIASLILVSIGIIGSANALPNQVLYALKIGVEDAQLALPRDSSERARLLIRFSQTRLDELDRLIQSGGQENIGIVVERYTYGIDGLTEVLNDLRDAGAPELAELENELTSIMEKYGLLSSQSQDPGIFLQEDTQDNGESARILSVLPARGQAGRRMSLYLIGDGTNFSSEISARFDQSSIRILAVEVINGSELILRIQIDDEAETGLYQIWINSAGAEIAGPWFEIDGINDDEKENFDSNGEENEGEDEDDDEEDGQEEDDDEDLDSEDEEGSAGDDESPEDPDRETEGAEEEEEEEEEDDEEEEKEKEEEEEDD